MNPDAPRPWAGRPARFWIALCLILVGGVLLRVAPVGGFDVTGPDETFYADYYVANLARHGPSLFPTLFADYIRYMQMPERQLVLPPGRIAFFAHAALLTRLGWEAPLDAVRAASLQASLLFLLASAAFALRWLEARPALVASALVAAAPLQLYIARRALVDGAFALAGVLVLWTLWEAIQKNARPAWRPALAVATAWMVLTKENSAFLAAALGVALLAVQAGAGWRERRFWMAWGALAAGGLLALAVLVLAAGGPDPLITAYALNVAKSYQLEYAIVTGDGPLHRYLLEFLTVNPAVTLLAVGGLFNAALAPRGLRLYLTVFLLVSWLCMSSVRYAMNLRYALAWDLPLCLFAALQIEAMAGRFATRRSALAIAALAGLAVVSGLAAFALLFPGETIYEPLPRPVLRAWSILKP